MPRRDCFVCEKRGLFCGDGGDRNETEDMFVGMRMYEFQASAAKSKPELPTWYVIDYRCNVQGALFRWWQVCFVGGGFVSFHLVVLDFRSNRQGEEGGVCLDA